MLPSLPFPPCSHRVLMQLVDLVHALDLVLFELDQPTQQRSIVATEPGPGEVTSGGKVNTR